MRCFSRSLLFTVFICGFNKMSEIEDLEDQDLLLNTGWVPFKKMREVKEKRIDIKRQLGQPVRKEIPVK